MACIVPPPPDRVGEGGGKGARSLWEAELRRPLCTGAQTELTPESSTYLEMGYLFAMKVGEFNKVPNGVTIEFYMYPCEPRSMSQLLYS